MDDAALAAEIARLAPWHFDVEVRTGLTTGIAHADGRPGSRLDGGQVSLISPGQKFRAGLLDVYPGGLAGRSVLDCACNCGAYLFWAKELGAGDGLGFDVREHWISQARFLLRHRAFPNEGLRFEVLDLYDVPRRVNREYDITFFSGIFYHLPDPIHGLRIAAERTRELILVDTATREGLADGMLQVDEEGAAELMSGVYGLNWFPTGPRVLTKLLAWLGFAHARVLSHRAGAPFQPEGMGRIILIAARTGSVFQRYDALVAASNAGR